MIFKPDQITTTTTSVPSPKPTCQSYNKAYNTITLRQSYTCYAILFVFASISTLLLQLTQALLPNWRTLIYALLTWISMVTLLRIRLKLATFERKVERSLKADILATFTRRKTLMQLAIYTIISNLLVYSAFILICQTTIPNVPTSRRQRHYGGAAQQLNVERLFVFIYASGLGLAFSLYRNFVQKWVIQLQVVQQHSLYLVKSSVRSNLSTPFYWSLGTFCVSYLAYMLFSDLFYKLATHFVGIFISVLDTPIVGFRWWDVALFFRMLMIGYSIVGAWVFVDLVADAYFNKVEDCISPYNNSLDCLLDGLRSKGDNQLRVRAFAELAKISSKEADKRKLLYNGSDEGNNNVNNSDSLMWSLIKTECITAMDELTNRINQEYDINKKQIKPTTDEPAKTTTTTKSDGKKSIQLVDGNSTVLTQRRQRTKSDSLDDRTTLVLMKIATRVSDAIPSPDIHLGQLVSTLWAIILRSNIGKSMASTRLDGQLGQWGNYLCNDSRNRKMCTVFGNPVIQVFSIQALSNLVVFSLKEDDLGYVKYDIPAILNTFLGCSTAIDNYLHSPPSQYSKLTTLPDITFLQAPFQLKLALNDAILKIKLTFKNYLDDIHVDAKYAARWDQF
ncbi:nucleoporin protein Ndc1-Nup [Chlamydoabsidia padenii]|nr:nucleoporin protein Ndc1-Nup [Chlamydoabsidia padenii]